MSRVAADVPDAPGGAAVDAIAVAPVGHPLDATVTVPGSKSLTNRALVCAALADGISTVDVALVADDVVAMREGLVALGAGLQSSDGGRRLRVTGTGGRLRPGPVTLDVRQSGTTSRFLLPVVALGSGPYRVDGAPSLRARPMGPVLDGIRALGATVEDEGEPGRLPVTVVAPGGLAGGDVAVAGDTSSQFLSGLLLAAPCTRDGVRLTVTTPLVSRPYVDLTVAVMGDFGVDVGVDVGGDFGVDAGVRVGEHVGGGVGDRPVLTVPPGGYRGGDHRVEPDASTASYALAAAAIVGGRVTVDGLGTGSRQGDARFADLLGAMGAQVERTATSTTVAGTGALRSLGDVDMADMPDLAQTLAAVAVFADAPTRVTGVALIRHHETDRIAAVVTELRRAGVRADATDDGFVVHPGPVRPARIETYDDHRMAMSFALLGLRAPGIEIADPACVAKTFPGYWRMLDELRDGTRAGQGPGSRVPSS
jgi:3-phosphoshikimate 1-carboxyvinyltransferase